MTNRKPEPARIGVGIYMADNDFAMMKAAFRADFLVLGGPHDTFAAWIGDALTRHASLGREQRIEWAQRAATTARSDGWRGRTFQVASEAVQQMRDALAQDATPQWSTTESSWARAAVLAAVARVEDQMTAHGESLTPYPDPLPRARLRRLSES